MNAQNNSQNEILFQAHQICKNFNETRALDHVDLTVYRGQICGLIGENGSGKSTISSIAAGMQKPTSGTMTFKGKPYSPETMLDGAKAGFGMIVQEMGTVSGISIAQNIFLGNEHLFKRFGIINRKLMNTEARKALERIGFTNVDPSAPIETLDMQGRKLVEIARVMYQNPEVLVVDETTTALSQKGRRIIYQLMGKMKAANKAVLFISHDLEEVMAYCDTLTVLRDGVLISTLTKQEFEADRIKHLMVGREMNGHYYRVDQKCTYSNNAVVSVRNLTTGRGLLQNISFDLHKGEILGVGGLSSCGMHELGRALFGEEPVVTGSVTH